MVVQKFQNKGIWIPWRVSAAIIAACFLAFLGVSEAKADFTAISSYVTTNYHKQVGVMSGSTGLLWTATSTGAVNKVSFSLCNLDTGTFGYYIYGRIGTWNGSAITWLATSTNSYEELDIFQEDNVAHCYGSIIDYAFYFQGVTINSGTEYVVKPITDESHLNDTFILLKSPHDTDFDVLEGLTEQDGMTPRFSVDYDPYYYDSEVEVIENPDYDPDEVVEIWSEDFSLDTKICYRGMSYGNCEWTFNYSRDYDEGYAYLLYEDDTQSRENAIASTSLPLVPLRQASFIVPEPATTGTYNYCVFLEQASSTDLYHSCGHIVKWYNIGDDITNNASSTDLNVIWKFVDRVTNVFPISLAKQIWSVFAAAKDATTTPVVLYLQDVMPDDGDTILGATNPPLLSYSLLKTYSYWDDIILRFMNYCVYLIGFFITIFLIFPALRGIDLGGHNKIPHTESNDIETRKVWKGNFITGYRPGTESRKYVNTKSVGRVYLGKKWK